MWSNNNLALPPYLVGANIKTKIFYNVEPESFRKLLAHNSGRLRWIFLRKRLKNNTLYWPSVPFERIHDEPNREYRKKKFGNFLVLSTTCCYRNSLNTIDQPPYSPDLTPSDFYLFPKLKLPLRGTRFDSIKVIKENSQRELKVIPDPEIQGMFRWRKRCHICIASVGAYFEGDKINIDED